ncbi:MAG: hypothetical protein G01um101466_502 [Parcubacteria group bacterium Gr01-1014_66]|nr:MAG: hypothetical protein G01um101466_502 [Parcubacteria group bacterium Gr01-1014_66]
MLQNMKKIFVICAVLIIASVAYVVITLKSGEEINERSPLISQPPPPPPSNNAIQDNLETMDEQTKKEFMEEVEKMQNEVMEKAHTMPIGPRLLGQADFKPRFHSVQGKALLIETDKGKVLRFEDFKTDNGPDLHIYLASDLSAADYIDLGKIRATKGNVNYEVSASVDTLRYNKVLVWCVPFGILFSYAELSWEGFPI